MSERLHYFTEASTPVSFDCSDSDIDSDLDDLLRRPISEQDRAKQHARQLQLWSDEARRRRSPAGVGVATVAPTLSPCRRPSSASLYETPLPPSVAQPPTVCPPPLPVKVSSPEMRPRLSADRQQSNLSERARLPNSRRVSRSHSAKNLRIRITPSSSSKSLLSDIESELGNSASAPQSPRGPAPVSEGKSPVVEKAGSSPIPASISIRAAPQPTQQIRPVPIPLEPIQTKSPTEPNLTSALKAENNKSNNSKSSPTPADSSRASNLGRRMSFSVRGKRLPSLKRLLRR